MNVIFLTLARLTDIENRGIYDDLMRKFRDEGHRVYIVCPVERRLGDETTLTEISGVQMLYVKTLNHSLLETAVAEQATIGRADHNIGSLCSKSINN